MLALVFRPKMSLLPSVRFGICKPVQDSDLVQQAQIDSLQKSGSSNYARNCHKKYLVM